MYLSELWKLYMAEKRIPKLLIEEDVIHLIKSCKR
jgi:hypothetical protein